LNFHHVPVLLNEPVEGLNIKPAGVYVDCTLGGGGHAYEIVRRMAESGLLIGIDQDAEAVAAAARKLENASSANVKIIRDNFINLETILQELDITGVDGFLADLGVSSFQLDNPERGFSYQHDAPLDMRMDKTQEFSAWDIVNNYSEQELGRVIWEYGEEKWARRIASFIVERRQRMPIETTGELVEVIKGAIPAKARRTGPHPAKRVFQALRIEVNNEMEVLRKVLHTMVKFLAPGGRVCIISFHSLEDRIVKETFREYSRGCTCPPDFPQCVCGKSAVLKILTKKPLEASKEEKYANPRARSAKLRIAEKLSCNKSQRR
jgi:16S rRNA (cytosine1402-N4)-methyltransferase